jgi:hypothetical protein
MSRTLRAVNVVAALAALASGLAVLASHLAVPAYPYGDSPAIIVAYCAFYGWVAWAFARGTSAAPGLALAKALGAYAFLALFVVAPDLGRAWTVATPARYVYQLFDWGPGAGVGMYGFVFLGRGAWNTVNAIACSRDWWLTVRARRPLLGRALTALPVAITVACVWQFMALVRFDAKTFSPEAHEIARLVEQTLSCDDVRAKAGTTTSDLRQRGDRQYRVTIRWGCGDTRILVRDPDDRVGVAVDARDCCPPSSPGGPEAAPGPTAPAPPAA